MKNYCLSYFYMCFEGSFHCIFTVKFKGNIFACQIHCKFTDNFLQCRVTDFSVFSTPADAQIVSCLGLYSRDICPKSSGVTDCSIDFCSRFYFVIFFTLKSISNHITYYSLQALFLVVNSLSLKGLNFTISH